MSKRKAKDSLAEVNSSDGKFRRTDSVFRNFVSEENDKFPPEKNRYNLYICNACPWANRCNAARLLKGLDSIIGLYVVHPTWQKTKPDDPEDEHHGWAFESDPDGFVVPPSGTGKIPNTGVIPDTVNGFKFVRDMYESNNDTHGKYTVPVLWDTKTKTIVNNESSEILRMFNGPFAKLMGTDKTTVDLYPESLQEKIDEVNSWIYPNINNGVYRCGFAKSQSAYDEAVQDLTKSLDRVESILSKQRYITSNDQITEADLRLFMTLIRYDEVYVVYFKTNTRTIKSLPNTNNWMKEMYQIPSIQKSIDMDHIKNHYFTSHPTLNTLSIVPKGPNVIADMQTPHDRDRFN